MLHFWTLMKQGEYLHTVILPDRILHFKPLCLGFSIQNLYGYFIIIMILCTTVQLAVTCVLSLECDVVNLGSDACISGWERYQHQYSCNEASLRSFL